MVATRIDTADRPAAIEVPAAQGERRAGLIAENARLVADCRTPQDLRTLIWNLAELQGGEVRGGGSSLDCPPLPDDVYGTVIRIRSMHPNKRREGGFDNPWVSIWPNGSDDSRAFKEAPGESPFYLGESVSFSYYGGETFDDYRLGATMNRTISPKSDVPLPTSYVTGQGAEFTMADGSITHQQGRLGPEETQNLASRIHVAWEKTQIAPAQT